MFGKGYFASSILLGVCLVPAARPNVIVSTSIELQTLAATTDDPTGAFQFLSPLTAEADADVQDSVNGDSGDSFQSASDASASASAATALANAASGASSADYSALSVSASSAVNIFGLDAYASTDSGSPYGSLSGTFQVADSSQGTVPVNVLFTALLNASQSLFTDALGVSATSETIFQLQVNGALLLFYDNPLAIGSDDSLSQSSSPSLSADTNSQSLGLLTNTPYSIYLEADAESSGLDSTPEPASALLLAAGILTLTAMRRIGRRH